LFLVSYLLNLLFAVRYLRKTEKPEIVWPFIYLMFMLFYNMTESTILNYNSQMFWVTYAATFCSARLSQEHSEVIEAIEGNDDENTVNQTA
jgi:exopolysaccharide production protein ExoQ